MECKVLFHSAHVHINGIQTGLFSTCPDFPGHVPCMALSSFHYDVGSDVFREHFDKTAAVSKARSSACQGIFIESAVTSSP